MTPLELLTSLCGHPPGHDVRVTRIAAELDNE